MVPDEVIRSTTEEKEGAIAALKDFHARHAERCPEVLGRLRETAVRQGNLFDALMEAAKVASLGQMSRALYEVGGQYRRNM